jgi:hypothetical protein
MSIDDFRSLGSPPPDGADYLHYDPPVLLFMSSTYDEGELGSLIAKLLYGIHDYGDGEDWVEILRFDYNPESKMGHDELHADVVRDGEKAESLGREELEDDANIPVPRESYYYPHFVASYARDKWTRFVEEYEKDKGMRRYRK